MSGRLVTAPDLSIMQIRADLVTAKSCLKEAENSSLIGKAREDTIHIWW